MAAQGSARPAHSDRAFEPKSKAGSDDPASQSHLPGSGHDERGRYGKSVQNPASRDGGPKTEPRPRRRTSA